MVSAAPARYAAPVSDARARTGDLEAIRRHYGVPESIVLRSGPGETIAFLPGFDGAARAVATAPDALPRSEHGGRAPLRRIETPAGAVLARPVRKGGLLRRARGRTFLGPWRPLQELVLLVRLRALRLPVVEGVGAVIRHVGRRWSGWLLTREVGGAIDLAAWLCGVRIDSGASDADVARRAGQAVRELHDAGVRHADLHPKNLLLTSTGRVLLLDLDKAVGFDRPLDESGRLANLLRLARSIDKLALQGVRTSPRHMLRFLEGYAGSRAAARSWFERVRTRRAPSRSWQGAWWRLTGQARPARVGLAERAP